MLFESLRKRWRRGTVLAGLLAAGLGLAPAAWARYRPLNWASIPDVPTRGDGEYYVSLTQSEYKVPDNATIAIDEVTNTSAACKGALCIDGEWVTIWMGRNSALTVKGANSPQYSTITGGGAGIYLPDGKNLILRYAADSGSATVKATGGDGYSAANGSNGRAGSWAIKKVNGGDGGSGACASGSGIGTAGAGSGLGESGSSELDGSSGDPGCSAATAGTLWVFDDIKVEASAGMTGGAGSGGSGGSCESTGSGGGGGGGGGGQAGAAADIGGGGGGGGGGGCGGKGYGCGGGGGGGGACSGSGGGGGKSGDEAHEDSEDGKTPDDETGGAGGTGGSRPLYPSGKGGDGGNQGMGGAAGAVLYVKNDFTLGGSGTGYADGRQSTFTCGAVTLDPATNGMSGVIISNNPDKYALKKDSGLLSTPVEPPKISQYAFLGYYTAESGGTQIFRPDGTVVSTAIGSAPTLYAHWSEDTGTAEQRAAQFIVNTTDDPADGAIVFYDGVVSLREAVLYVQMFPDYENARGTRAITFADTLYSGSQATITLTRELADSSSVAGEVTIEIAGPESAAGKLVLSGGGTTRIVNSSHVGAAWRMDRLTLQDGNTSGNGGALSLASGSSAFLNDCVISNSVAGGNGGGVYVASGATLFAATNTVFASCEASSGGAVCFEGCPLSFKGCLFSGNKATYNAIGCDIVHCTGTSDTVMLFDSCSVVGNTAPNSSYWYHISCSGGRFTLVNSTVEGNDNKGIGICAYGYAVNANAVGCTFRNVSMGVYGAGGGNLNVLNSICVGTGTDIYQTGGTLTAIRCAYGTTNGVPTLTDCTQFSSASDVFTRSDGDPLVIPGYVPKHAEPLKSGTAATTGAYVKHDAMWTNIVYALPNSTTWVTLIGNSKLAKDYLATDITGIDRRKKTTDKPQPAMGSLWPGDLPSLTVTTLDDALDPTDGLVSLREAVKYAGESPTLAENGQFKIAFDESICSLANFVTCRWTQTQIEVKDLKFPLVIESPESKTIVLDGNTKWRHFRIASGNRLDLNGMKLVNGFGADYGSTLPGTDGGSILNYGTLNALNCHFSGNRAGGNYKPASGIENLSGSGGAVFNGADAAMLAHWCTFSGNRAANGGAIAGAGTQTVASVTFSENRAGVGTAGGSEGKGGGAYVTGGDAVFVHCTFVGNDAGDGGAGGAVYALTGESDVETHAHLASSIVVGNWAGAKSSDIHASGAGVIDLGCVACGVTNGTAKTWFYADSSFFGVAPSQLFPDSTATGANPVRLATGVGHVYYPVYESCRDTGVRIGTKTEGQYDGVYFEYRSGVWKPLRGRSGRFLPATIYTDNRDQLDNSYCENFLGAVMVVGETGGDPVPSVQVDTYVVSQATWTAFADAVNRLAASGPTAENKITFAGPASNATITAGDELTLVAFTNVPLVVQGPITFTGSGGRFVTLTTDNNVVFRNVKFVSGGSASLDIGGAIWGVGGNHLTTSNCLFSMNSAQWGGAIGMDGQSVLDFRQTSFVGNAAASEAHGNDVYQEKGTSAITGGSFNPSGFVVWATSSAALMTSAYAAKSWYTVSGSGDGAVAALNAEATPEVSELTVSSDMVSLTPGNVKPFLWYALERADSPVGPYVTVESSWIQADANGNLPAALTAPATGTSGFYRVTTSATRE